MGRVLAALALVAGCRQAAGPGEVCDWPPREMAGYTVAQASFFSDTRGAWGPLEPARGLYVACWHLVRGTRVEFRAEGRVCTAVVADRGPAKHLVRRGRVWDMSPALFRRFWPHERGVGKVAARVVKEDRGRRSEE
jgi:hypothetical protein